MSFFNKYFLLSAVFMGLIGCTKPAKMSHDNTQTCKQIAIAYLNDQPIDSLLESVAAYRSTLNEEQQKNFDTEFAEMLAEEVINGSSYHAIEIIALAGDVNAVIVAEMIKTQLSIAEALPEYFRKPYLTAYYKYPQLFDEEDARTLCVDYSQLSPMYLFVKVDPQTHLYVSQDDENYRQVTLGELDEYVSQLPTDELTMQVFLYVSENTSVKTIADIKQILRKYSAITIIYRTCSQ